MDLNGDHDLSFCDGCVYGKHHYTPFLLSGGSCAKEVLGFFTYTYVVYGNISWRGKVFSNLH
jgi:hypothetical protein